MHQFVFTASLFQFDHEVAACYFPGCGSDPGVGVDEDVEVVLDGVEVAGVVVADERRHDPFADLVDIVGGDVQWADDGIKGFVDTGNDLLEVAVMFAGVGTGGKFSFYGGLA
ncbi:hypothetical protein OR1_04209 [Geobacter sp. OR-1]|nr:hypothetical protein OR1_04209 [Geobacter sp. OR-1]